ncbi:hypothetical protein GIB67_034740 [Kingdonia uniflora]|uniref:FCP1 homology domain-containing protein n=1 Tax=Kingdonia uniflora TaxID=39325 RepID=A0A7J7ML39_9MAGN|nr:hypothetical protein GIB67_034740 [Kingdonia uniflora]
MGADQKKQKRSRESPSQVLGISKMDLDTSLKATGILSKDEELTSINDSTSQASLNGSLDSVLQVDINDAELSKTQMNVERKNKRSNSLEEENSEISETNTTSCSTYQRKKKKLGPLLDICLEHASLVLSVSEATVHCPETNDKRNNPENYDLEGKPLSGGSCVIDVTKLETETTLIETSPMQSISLEHACLELPPSEATVHCPKKNEALEKKKRKRNKKKKRNNPENYDLEGKPQLNDSFGLDVTNVKLEIQTSNLEPSQLELISLEHAHPELSPSEATIHCPEMIEAPEKKMLRKKKKRNNPKNSDLEGKPLLNDNFCLKLSPSEATVHCPEMNEAPERKKKKRNKKRKRNNPENYDLEGKPQLNDSFGSDVTNVKLEIQTPNLEPSQLELISLEHARPELSPSEATIRCPEMNEAPEKKKMLRKKKKRNNPKNFDLEGKPLLNDNFCLKLSPSEATVHCPEMNEAPERKKKKQKKKKNRNNPENYDLEGKPLLNDNFFGSDTTAVDSLDRKGSHLASYTSKKKLLILDLNGLLADIVSSIPEGCKADKKIANKFLFKRPFCDSFLKFCFEKFNVGVWSSRIRRNMEGVVKYLMRNMKDKILFFWDQSHCTKTKFKTIDDVKKPLVLKELKKLWNVERRKLPWIKGDYNESNTLLLDDSPYKALRNPPNTAIFPHSYSFQDANDNSLGPGGDLRNYLEGLAMAEDVQKYVEHYPFGQHAITSTHPCWNFYLKVIEG